MPTQSYQCLNNVLHNGKRYPADSAIELTETEAAPLLKMGAISKNGPAVKPSAEEEAAAKAEQEAQEEADEPEQEPEQTKKSGKKGGKKGGKK